MTQLEQKEIYTSAEVLDIIRQAWWAGFNTSGEGKNAEHCITSITDLKNTCNDDTIKLLEGTLKNQLPD